MPARTPACYFHKTWRRGKEDVDLGLGEARLGGPEGEVPARLDWPGREVGAGDGDRNRHGGIM